MSLNQSINEESEKLTAAKRYNQGEELQRNLDPLLFVDGEFVASQEIQEAVPEEKEQNSSDMSFIELTTQIAHQSKIEKPKQPTSAKVIDMIKGMELDNQPKEVDTRVIPTRNAKLMQQAPGALRYGTGASHSSRQQTRLQREMQQRATSKKSSCDDYQIMHREDSTDIRLPEQATNFTATSNGFYSKNKLRQFQYKTNTAPPAKFIGQKQARKTRYATISSQRFSNDAYRNSNLNKAYLQGGSPPRLGKQRGSAQPIAHGALAVQKRERLQSAWNYTLKNEGEGKHNQVSQMGGGTNFQQQSTTINGQLTEATFDELDYVKVSVPVQSSLSTEVQLPQKNYEQNRQKFGSAAQEALRSRKRSSHVQMTASLRAKEHRINHVIAMRSNRRQIDRPKSSNYAAKDVARLRSELKSQKNMDLSRCADPNGIIFTNHHDRFLRKNGSAYIGSMPKGAQFPMTVNMTGANTNSIPINVTSGGQQLQQSRRATIPNRKISTAERESSYLIQGGSIVTDPKKKSLNQVSSMSCMNSESRMPDQHGTVEAASSPRSITEAIDKTILSRTQQPKKRLITYQDCNSVSQTTNHHPNRILTASRQSKRYQQKQQLILFPNGEQIKLDVPGSQQSYEDLATNIQNKRKLAMSIRSRYEIQPKTSKWITQNGKKNAKVTPDYNSMRQAPITKKVQHLKNQQRLIQKNAKKDQSDIASIQVTTSQRNQDLETPETQFMLSQGPSRTVSAVEENPLGKKKLKVQTPRSASKQVDEPNTPQPESREKFAAPQVKYAYDHMQVKTNDEAGRLLVYANSDGGSIERMNPCDSNTGFDNRIIATSENASVSPGRPMPVNNLTAVEVMSPFHTNPDVKSFGSRQSKNVKVKIQDQRSLNNVTSVEQLAHPKPTAQHRYHEHCGRESNQGDYNSNRDHLKSPNSRSPGAVSIKSRSLNQSANRRIQNDVSGRSRVNTNQNRQPQTHFNNVEKINLNRIKQREDVLKNQRKTVRSQANSKGPSQSNKIYYISGKKQSGVMKRQRSPPSQSASRASRRGCYICVDCKDRTIEKICNSQTPIKNNPKFIAPLKMNKIVKSPSKQSSKRAISSRNLELAYKSTSSHHNGLIGIGSLSIFNTGQKKKPIDDNQSVRSCRMSCRSLCNNSNYKQILNRKFQIDKDLSKYSQSLSYAQSMRKFDMYNRTFRGKSMAGNRKKVERQVQVDSRFNREREAMKKMDWGDSDIYDAFRESKATRKPIEQVLHKYAAMRTPKGDQMYTDVELQYFMQLIRKKDCKDKAAEVAEENKAQIIMDYYNRSLYTLQGLTKLLKIEFHYERLFRKYETSFTVETVLMLMTRARKLYQAIEMIITIIKLIDKLKALEQPLQVEDEMQEVSPVQRRFTRNPAQVKNMKERIRCHIKSFLAQHTLFPVQFIFGNVDQLSNLKGSQILAMSKQSMADATIDKDGIINLRVSGGHGKMSKRGSNGGSRPHTATAGAKKSKKKKQGQKSVKGSIRCSMCSSQVVSERRKMSMGGKSARLSQVSEGKNQRKKAIDAMH